PLSTSRLKNGVSLSFLRKKTQEKEARDGGMRFEVAEARQCEPGGVELYDGWGDGIVELRCMRVSEGQVVSKTLSEKIVAKEVIRRIVEDPNLAGKVVSKWCVFDDGPLN
ncbi:hypothetical protein TrRE_jg7948, partial [Triparma retinervis]